MFKQLANMANMMKQAREIGSKMQEMQAELRGKRVTGSSGGGMISVEANGLGEILAVKIDDKLTQDREMIEDLLPAAINDAITKSKQLHAEAMKELTGGMGLPGLDEAIEGFANPQQ